MLQYSILPYQVGLEMILMSLLWMVSLKMFSFQKMVSLLMDQEKFQGHFIPDPLIKMDGPVWVGDEMNSQVHFWAHRPLSRDRPFWTSIFVPSFCFSTGQNIL